MASASLDLRSRFEVVILLVRPGEAIATLVPGVARQL
jgi:hypothetical protein